MRVLGISCFYHDAAAALLVDGQLVAAAEEERFSRVKHDWEFPARAVSFCLERAGLTGADLDLVVFYEKPFRKLDRILMSTLATWPRSMVAFREAMLVWLLDKLWVRDILQERIGCKRDRIVFCPHHMSHAASAFYPSGLEKSAILTVDGVGEWASGTRGTAWDQEILLDEEMCYPHSLGLLYSAFTAFLGFQVNEGEYKVMGMAPYGQPRFADLILDKMVHLRPDGSFRLDMDYFAYHHSAFHSFSDRFVELLGPARSREESNLLEPHYADVAASIQKVAEEILVRQASWLHRRTGHEALCMAGGVALNSVANSRILRESGFKKLYIQPAAGDGGGALGAALWGYHQVLGGRERFRMDHCYWGQEHTDREIVGFLRSEGHACQEFPDLEAVCSEVAERLACGQVIGWMQGRFEWGPRALGARSILADPRASHMKDVVNARIKFREPFRPFAPSVLAERVEDYFQLPDALGVDPARFMLMVVPVCPERREEIPAVTHVDGTARIQAVHREQSPEYHEVISRFCQLTGVPVVLNTSFNLRGEPIVNTPAEACSTFARSDMDALVMGRFLVSRRAAGEGRLVPGAELEKWAHAPQRASGTEKRPGGEAELPGAAHALFGVRPEEGAASRPGGNSLGGTLGKVALILLTSLVLLEILLRLLVPNPNMQVRGMYLEDEGGIRLRPGWQGRIHSAEFDTRVEIGKDGMRALPLPSRAEGGTVLALGDSFTFGCWSEADSTWLARLQRAAGVRVLNAGIPNAGTDAEASWLRGPGASLRADLLMVSFYTGNDFHDNLVGRDSFTLDSGFLVLKPAAEARWSAYDCLGRTPPPQTELPSDARRPWYRGVLMRSHLYQYGRSRMYGGTRSALRPSLPQAWFLRRYTPEMEQALAQTTEYLDDLLMQAKARGIPMVLVVIPSSQEVYDEEWQAWLAAWDLEEELFDRSRPRRFLLEWARQRNVAALDLLSAFRGRERLYYRADMHWNDLGHFHAGEKVAEFLREQALPGRVEP
ncbi:MAG: carbamoyltransferase N-terminal domain-containing protein [Candidatus Xenobium sp.]|jgi:carbamoyltransferase